MPFYAQWAISCADFRSKPISEGARKAAYRYEKYQLMELYHAVWGVGCTPREQGSSSAAVGRHTGREHREETREAGGARTYREV